jgi:hypothetical protein
LFIFLLSYIEIGLFAAYFQLSGIIAIYSSGGIACSLLSYLQYQPGIKKKGNIKNVSMEPI